MTKGKKKYLYPDEKTPLLEHYSEFDNVFVGLSPFFKLDKEFCDTNSSKKEISIEEARKKDEIFKNIGHNSNVTVYTSNECYPTDEEISRNGKLISWSEILKSTELNNFQELNKALMTSIGAFKRKLKRIDLLEILNRHSEKNNLWHPEEGTFNFLTKVSIHKILKRSKIKTVIVEDEFRENKQVIDLGDITEKEFCEKIDFQDFYIYDNDKSILFAIGWDFFFFFIAINDNTFSKEEIEKNFEGFWADEKTTHLWTWEEGEIEKLLNTND